MGTKIPRKQSSGGSVAGEPCADGADFNLPSEELYRAHREVEALKHQYQETCDLPSIAYFTLDVHGRVIEADATTAELLGLDRIALQECHLASLVAPESRSDFNGLWERVFNNETTQSCELCFLKYGQTSVNVLIEACASAADSAADRRVRIAALRIMSGKMMQMALQEVYGSFEKLVRERTRRIAEVSMPADAAGGRLPTGRVFGDAVMTTDANGYVTYLNLAAEHYTGWNSMDAAGMPARKVFIVEDGESRHLPYDPVRTCLQEKRAVALENGSLLDRRIGGKLPIRGSVTLIHDAGGQTIGATLTFRQETGEAQAALHGGPSGR